MPKSLEEYCFLQQLRIFFIFLLSLIAFALRESLFDLGFFMITIFHVNFLCYGWRTWKYFLLVEICLLNTEKGFFIVLVIIELVILIFFCSFYIIL